jgi:hypothetical protein
MGESMKDAARRLARESCAARGLPLVIDDPAIYRRSGYLIQRAEQRQQIGGDDDTAA